MLDEYTAENIQYSVPPLAEWNASKRGNTGHGAYSKRNSNVIDTENQAFIFYKSIQSKHVKGYLCLLSRYIYFKCQVGD